MLGRQARLGEGQGFSKLVGYHLLFTFFWFFMLAYEASLVAQRVKRLPARRDPWFGKIPWRRKWQPTLVLLPGKSRGRRSLVQATVRGVAKSRT